MKPVTLEQFLVGVTNDIKISEGKTRQRAKSPYFLLMYSGTWRGLVKQFGFSIKVSKGIENGYHKLYKTFAGFIRKAIKKAHRIGYVTGCFGLRLKTPIIEQTKFKGRHKKQFLAESEARTAGNLVGGQSYCMLTLRALGDFMERVHASKWRNDIAPISTIYDSIYLDIPIDLECLEWCNKNLIECMCNIDGAPELEHDQIKVGADLCVYYPNWSNEITLPNHASKSEMEELINKGIKEYAKKNTV